MKETGCAFLGFRNLFWIVQVVPKSTPKVLCEPYIKNVTLKRCKYIASRLFRNEALPITTKVLSVVRIRC